MLLDAHLLLWAGQFTVASESRLPEQASRLIEDVSNELHFSLASIWEIVIKHSRRPQEFVVDPRRLRLQLIASGYTEVPVTAEHALAVGLLPHVHRDPFDRILVAQACVEGMTLLTADVVIAQYPGPIRLV